MKFFPIFFKQAVRLRPGATNIVFAVTPIALAAASWLAQYLGARIGAGRGYARLYMISSLRDALIWISFWVYNVLGCGGNLADRCIHQSSSLS